MQNGVCCTAESRNGTSVGRDLGFYQNDVKRLGSSHAGFLLQKKKKFETLVYTHKKAAKQRKKPRLKSVQ